MAGPAAEQREEAPQWPNSQRLGGAFYGRADAAL